MFKPRWTAQPEAYCICTIDSIYCTIAPPPPPPLSHPRQSLTKKMCSVTP